MSDEKGTDMTALRQTWEAFPGQQAAFGYAQAVRVGDTVWIAGSPGCDKELLFPDNLGDQVRQAYANVRESVEHFGGSLRDLVEQTVFVLDIAEYLAQGPAARKEVMGSEDLPVSALVQVSGFLLPQMLVLVKATAVIGSS